MNTEIIFVVLWIKYLVITKWHISDNHIKEVVRISGILKSCDADIGILIELLCDSARYAVQLHSIQSALLHGLRHASKEVSNAHRRLQYIAASETKLHKCRVDA